MPVLGEKPPNADPSLLLLLVLEDGRDTWKLLTRADRPFPPLS
jgi:hypothetical protein